MSEWPVHSIDDLIEQGIIIAHKDGNHGSNYPRLHEFGKQGVPFLTAKSLDDGGRIDFLNAPRLSYDKAKQITFGFIQDGDVLLSHNATVGRVAVVPKLNEEVLIGTSLTHFRLDSSRLHPQYLAYYFKGIIFQNQLAEIMSQTTRNQVPITTQRNLIVSLPPLPEQKAIASVLSSLDDKIDLLHRQNRTLEAMAETLFRQWFVQEADESWEEGKLGDEFDFTMGQSPEGSSFNEAGVGVPMFQGNADFGFRFPSERVYTTEPTRFAEPLDTLVSVRAPVGEQNMALVKCCIGRGVAAFRYKANRDYYTYTYFKIRSLMSEIRQFNDEGTVFGSIGKADFQALNISVPPKACVHDFEKTARPINDKVIENSLQIKTLEKLRDTLLPKLMSGEVRVKT